MSRDASQLCPFSKPIIGGWCHCEHASLAERCSGKMSCTQADQQRPDCLHLVDVFRERARFVLGLRDGSDQLTHAQLMKIRCGGLLGMQRLLQPQQQGAPSVIDMKQAARQRFGSLDDFPYSDIVSDMQAFSHRKLRRQKP